MPEMVPGLGWSERIVTELTGAGGRGHEVRYVRVSLPSLSGAFRRRIADLLRAIAFHLDATKSSAAA